MLTAVKYCVVWSYREGDLAVRRTLYSASPRPCIEAARIISGNPYTFDVEVLEVDTGKKLSWEFPIGHVLFDVEK